MDEPIVIPFFSTLRQHAQLASELAAATARVIQSNNYILGSELAAFEIAWAQFCGTQYAIGVANGTDAITLSLMACDIGQGDEVITSANTSPYTALAIAATGATPVFVDIAPATYTMDPNALESAYSARSKAIVPVHLYGQAADIEAIANFAHGHHLRVIEDACQAHGACVRGQRVGTFGDCGAFSFYPTKNLGALGDAGAIVTNDAALAQRARQLRNGGRVDRDHHAMIGVNSRLDEIQAALLTVKLSYLEAWNTHRRMIAERYTQAFATSTVQAPPTSAHTEPVFHLYVVRTPHRDALRKHLARAGIGTLIHYPIPLHQHGAFRSLGYPTHAFPISASAANEIVSLPIYPELTDAEVERIIAAVLSFDS